MKINKNEALKCIGGAGLTAAFLSALTSLINTVYRIGQDIGRSFRERFYNC